MSTTHTGKSAKEQDFFDEDFEITYDEDLDDYDLDDLDDLNDTDDSDGDDFDDTDDGNDFDDDDYDDDDFNDDDGFDDDDYDDDYDDFDDDDYDDGDRRSRKRGRKKNGKRKDNQETERKKKRRAPNLVSPAAKAAKTGTKALFKLLNWLLRGATLILIAVIFYILLKNFWQGHSAYGDLFQIAADDSHILAAYLAVAGFLLLFELISFFLVLFGKGTTGRGGRRQDTGRGLFSFLFIAITSLLSCQLYAWIPLSPAALSGVQGAVLIYGGLYRTLLPLCIAGIISCLLRKFLIR